MAGINNSTNLYTPNTVIVGGTSPLTTITEGLLAATALGIDTTVYVRAGTYTEDLTLLDGINIVGASAHDVIIDGQHTVPAAGNITISNVKLAETVGARSIFVEAGAGTCDISVESCIFAVDSGMIFNLPLSTGDLEIVDCTDISVQNSIIDNTTGLSQVNITGSRIGVGAVAAIFAGNTQIMDSYIDCPVSVIAAGTFTVGTSSVLIDSLTSNGTSVVTIAGGSYITGVITANDTSTIVINNSSVSTGAAGSIVIAVGATVSLNNSVVTSSAVADVISGAGTVILGQVVFTDGDDINVATTQTYGSQTITGVLHLDAVENGPLYAVNGLVDSLGALTDGQLLVGSTGNPPVAATLTAGAGVSVVNAAGSITLSTTSTPFAWAQVGADGALVTNQGSINTKVALLIMSLPVTSAVGDTMILQGLGAGGWSVTQAANQQIIVGNDASTVGVGGSVSSTDANDSISLVCTTADLVWSTYSMIGNLTIV